MIYIPLKSLIIVNHTVKSFMPRENFEPLTVADQDTTIHPKDPSVSSLRCITDADSAPRQRCLGLATSSVKGHSNHLAKLAFKVQKDSIQAVARIEKQRISSERLFLSEFSSKGREELRSWRCSSEWGLVLAWHQGRM